MIPIKNKSTPKCMHVVGFSFINILTVLFVLIHYRFKQLMVRFTLFPTFIRYSLVSKGIGWSEGREEEEKLLCGDFVVSRTLLRSPNKSLLIPKVTHQDCNY